MVPLITPMAATTSSSASLALIVILTLIVLLIQKEVASGLEGPQARRLSKTLNISIVPLLVVCASIGILRIVEVLR